MSERDDELLRRYRATGRDEPPAAVDAAILAASRRSLRASPVRRWAAPVSVAAVLVLALGLVLKVQREAPEAVMPAESRVAPEPAAPATAPAIEAPVTAPTAAPTAPRVGTPAARPGPAKSPEPKRVQAPARKGELIDAAPPAKVEPAPQAADVAAPRAAAAATSEERAQGAAAPQAPPAMQAAPVPSPAPMLRSNAARARADTLEKSTTSDPQRELERIARLRAEGKDDEADRALAAFQHEHADYRIEPAMWDRVRRR